MTAEILSFETGRPAEIAEGEPALVVDVGGYEGPLDLLLTLARQQKVDLSKISILALADLPMAMTAHVVFSALDPAQPATTSATIIERVIRSAIGFQGLLMSDDVSMNALAGSIAERTRAIVAAGCDMVLHCNGKLDEMREVASQTPELSGRALERAVKALASRKQPQPFDRKAARVELDALVERAGMA